MTHEVYTPSWRTAVRAGAQRSAEVLAPLLAPLVPAHGTAVDIGCGEGWLVQALRSCGVETIGVDGPWVTPRPDIVANFAHPRTDLGEWDLAVCLETAEHVEPEHAAGFVAWLCERAPVVAFSAAIPGQGGEGHVNEQWPAYWSALFRSNGYGWIDDLRWRIWDDERIEPWYRQNLLLFSRGRLSLGAPPAVVHPGLWAHHGHR